MISTMNTITTKQIFLHNPERGIALLVAVVFTAVMLAIGTALSSLGYKQVILSSTAIASQHAFYAADSALECVLSTVYNQPQSVALGNKQVFCNGNTYTLSENTAPLSSWTEYSISPMSSIGKNICAQVVVYWPKTTSKKAYVYTTGYNNKDCSVTSYTTTQGLQVSF